MNQWRSPTAEKRFANRSGLLVRSRGTHSRAKRKVTAADLNWADILFPMETQHAKQLRSQFPHETEAKPMHILDIPDDYRFMDPELVAEIEAAVIPLLDELGY